MDSGVLARILDDVLDYGGDYTVERIDLGKAHQDESHAVIMVGADSADRLSRILMRLQVHGVNQVDPGEAVVRPAPADGVFPDDFYSTTNLETRGPLAGPGGRGGNPGVEFGVLVSPGGGGGTTGRTRPGVRGRG